MAGSSPCLGVNLPTEQIVGGDGGEHVVVVAGH